MEFCNYLSKLLLVETSSALIKLIIKMNGKHRPIDMRKGT